MLEVLPLYDCAICIDREVGLSCQAVVEVDDRRIEGGVIGVLPLFTRGGGERGHQADDRDEDPGDCSIQPIEAAGPAIAHLSSTRC